MGMDIFVAASPLEIKDTFFNVHEVTGTPQVRVQSTVFAFQTTAEEEKEFALVERVRKHVGEQGLIWNMKEAETLESLEKAGVTGVPRLLHVGSDGTLDMTIVSGIELDDDRLVTIFNERTFCKIVIDYLHSLCEVFDVGYINLDQLKYNCKVEITPDGKPERINLFDITAEKCLNGKIVLKKNEYMGEFMRQAIPHEVYEAFGKGEKEVSISAQRALLFVIGTFLEDLATYRLFESTFQESVLALAMNLIGANSNDQLPEVSSVVSFFIEMQKQFVSEGQELQEVLRNKGLIDESRPRRRLNAVREGFITAFALHQIEETLAVH